MQQKKTDIQEEISKKNTKDIYICTILDFTQVRLQNITLSTTRPFR